MKTANNPDTSFVIPVRNSEMQFAHVYFLKYKDIMEAPLGGENN